MMTTKDQNDDKSADTQLTEDPGQSGPRKSERGNWDNPIEFILSCLSFAVGLGNIWRFPYLCYRNGGGAFLVPYILSLVLMGIPVFLFEMGSGQFSSEGPIKIWNICPIFQGIGYGMLMLSLYIGIYYNILISWAFFYLFSSFTTSLPWSTCDNDWNTLSCRSEQTNTTDSSAKMSSDEFFHKYMLKISSGIDDITGIRWELAGCLLLAWIIVYCALWKGIKSIGKAVYVTALFPYVILVVLLVRAATLPGYLDGINFYLTPQWDRLADIRVWADACTQIFFSLGVTWGVMVTLASYNKFNNNVYRDAIMVAFGNCCTSVFAGFVIFGIIGFMAHELEMDVKDVVTQGPGLAFIAYPEAVLRMPLSPLWSCLFFSMLLFLGFGTQFSTTETVITILLDQFPQLRGDNRKWVTLAVCSFMFLVGLSMVTDGGIYIFQVFDNHSATYSALILGCLEVTAMSWIYGADRFLDDLHLMLGFYPYPRIFWKWAWKIFAPMIVVCILIFTALDYDGNKYGEYRFPSWANFLGWILTFSSIAIVPIVAIIKITKERGSFYQRISKLLKCNSEWRPKGSPCKKSCEMKTFEKNDGQIEAEQSNLI